MTPTPFALIVLACGLLVPARHALSALVLLCLFGASAAFALPALGGATVTPAAFYLPFFLLRALSQPASPTEQRGASPASFWLVLLAGWAVLGAVLMPRLFAGEMQILTVDRSDGGLAARLLPLGPVSGNLTQAGYALGGVAAFIAARHLLTNRQRLEQFGGAVLWLGALNCLAAVINLGEYYAGFPSVLPAIRNANYAIFDAYEEAGLMRVQGTFSETSAFASFTLPLFAFAFSLWLQRARSPYSGAVALVSLLFLLISTSSTAYVSLALYLAGVLFATLYRLYADGRLARPIALVTWIAGAVLVLACVALLKSEVFLRVAEFARLTVLGKLQSSSGVERNAWNQQAWSNFLDTYGFGVGLGSARASGFLLVLLSNVGLLGTFFFVAFAVAVCRNAPGPFDSSAAVPRAARQAFIAALVTAFISGAVFDLGLAFYAFAAAASRSRAWRLGAAESDLTTSSTSARWQRAAASQL